MAKNSLTRKEGIVQQDGQIARYNEEQITIDNNPLPKPEELQKYQNIDPKFADEFLKAWQEERLHRHKGDDNSMDMARIEQQLEHQRKQKGMLFAFLIMTFFIAATCYALYLDMPWFAGVGGLFTLGTIIKIFVDGSREA